jgi:endonuclease/exonuclease/phosphatase family metal-dependent hydrolase
MDPALADVTTTLRVATYNVRGCVGVDRRRSETRIAEVIASLRADIVGLQEIDRGRARSAGLDQAAAIAEQLGWHFVFHPAMQRAEEQYGNAIVSRFPLRLERVCALVGRGAWYCRETRAALWAEAETSVGTVHVINTHFGLGPAERLRQAEQLASEDWIGAAPDHLPLVLLGDFNNLPRGPAYRALTSRLRDTRMLLSARTRTFPTPFPLAAVDHIFINAALHPVALQVHRTPLARIASDHYPLVAELALAL